MNLLDHLPHQITVTWLKTRAQAKGTTMSAEAEAILQQARTHDAGAVVEQQAAGALQDAIHAGIGAGFDALVQQLGPLFDLLTLEAVRARMMTEEFMIQDYANLACPQCGVQLGAASAARAWVAQRSAFMLQKARDALAAGTVPRLRVW